MSREHMDNDEREFYLADVARMYYEENKTQAEIARQLKCARSSVSMMLAEAMQLGIIKIQIQYPLKRVPDIEKRLKEEFNLNEALVINRGNVNYANMLRMIGRMGATYLQSHLPLKGTLGIGWGAAVAEVPVPQNHPCPEMKVVRSPALCRD